MDGDADDICPACSPTSAPGVFHETRDDADDDNGGDNEVVSFSPVLSAAADPVRLLSAASSTSSSPSLYVTCVRLKSFAEDATPRALMRSRRKDPVCRGWDGAHRMPAPSRHAPPPLPPLPAMPPLPTLPPPPTLAVPLFPSLSLLLLPPPPLLLLLLLLFLLFLLLSPSLYLSLREDGGLDFDLPPPPLLLSLWCGGTAKI
mmetsp:Transcript_75237/g.147310  ORF Transcript_75237/g.147310 Transcript_75237/m.147310 type:complete len:202 (+) Transcript_75237:241-846(+)